ncbi:SpaH/EbpB family LPXTG-anchored major pilin [Longibaculum muris]|uniref:SpaH/EbpB family LPXTG-anchored major pilin n=1 Tax=Longibaculum muris TaxID=1796628 RepID=UPI0022E11A12|nr:SpaH/EbpB family LPXTG-anchored major pilin [Longibaculum muris]
MKKRRIIKSIFASMLAIIMVLSLTSIVSAADTATLTINNTVAGKTVDLYQVFSAAKNATTNAVSYTLKTEYENFFKSDNKYGCINLEDSTALSEAAYKYVAKLSDDAKVEFAKEILKWSLDPINTVSRYNNDDINTTETSTQILVQNYGFYLVYLKGASDITTSITDVKEYSPAILVNVTDPNVDINMKSSYPTVDKKIDNKDYGEAAIGDEIKYTLTSNVPDMTGYSSYTFKFKDILSPGLTFNSDSVTLSIDNTNITNETDVGEKYSVNNITGDDGKTTVTIELKDFISYANQVGKRIVVTYTATLNENALVGTDANNNSAVIEYSNDPSDSSSTEDSTPDIVPVYSFDILIHKFYIDSGGNKQSLAGAGFKLYYDSNCTQELKLIKSTTDAGEAVYQLNMDTAADSVEAMSPDNGNIQIKGLDANKKYYLKETKTPDKFNSLLGPIEFEIVPSYDTDGKTLDAYNIHYTYNSHSENTTDNVLNVENKTGEELPDTGGMGTVIFTVGGLAIIGIMVGFSVMSKKKKKM